MGFASHKQNRPSTTHDAFKSVEAEVNAKIQKLLSIKGKRTIRSMHWELGRMVWEKCGMARDRQGLEEAIATIPKLREQFWHEVSVPGEAKGVNPALEQASRVADFMEF